MRRFAAVALMALLNLGCNRDPTLKWIQKGRVEMAARERDALEILFAGTKASKVSLVVGEGSLAGEGSNAIRVDDGHVVGLAAYGEVPAEALGAFPELRHLTLYRSKLESLEGLGPWPQLEELRLDFTPLATLDGIAESCPALVKLAVSHGPIADLGPLRGLTRLEEIRLDRSALLNLTSAPELPSLKALYLTSGPLESLEGLERFTGLETLQFFGVRGLTGLDLPSLEHLRELALYQNGLTALSGLPPLPALERIETSDNEILSVQLGDLPKLRELEMHEEDLLSLELGVLPELETVDLRGEGSLFKKGGRLRDLEITTEPALERLDLRHNHLRHLAGLAPQPALRQIDLDDNPFDDLERLGQGFPALRHVSVRRTAVAELPDELGTVPSGGSRGGDTAGLIFSYDPAEIEANMWEGVLRDAFEKAKSSFVEKLPTGGGGLRGHGHRCSFRTSTFSTPRLHCTGTIREVSGLVHLELVEVDPLSPGGGPNHFPIRATIRTQKGRARIYVKYELDIRGRAEALAGYRDPDRPWITFGDQRDPDDVRKGYAFAEARPGEPDSTSGEAHVLVDRLVVWVEGLDGAEGVEYVIESPYQ